MGGRIWGNGFTCPSLVGLTRASSRRYSHSSRSLVSLQIVAGLVWGEELYFDSTKVQANAAIDRLMPRVEWEAQKHLHELFEKKVDPEGTDSGRVPAFIAHAILYADLFLAVILISSDSRALITWPIGIAVIRRS